jgi:hypothetical protein
MAQDLDVRQFFRRSPPDLLRRYFERKEVSIQIDWASIRPRNIEPLMEAWQALDADTRGHMVEDFSNIRLLATPIGKVQIIDEALYHGKQEEVAANLAELDDYYDCAFWVFLEQPACWNGAVFYAAADSKPKRYWRKRINMPRLGRPPTSAEGSALGTAIAELFRKTEGRGDPCEVHQYRRGAQGEKEYYFAYPQDHRQTTLEYHEGQMTKRPYNPAFEIIFIHEDEQQTLTTWYQGKKERVNDLQVAFAKAVLGRDIPRESPRDDRVYVLGEFLNPDFKLRPQPELGIANAEIRMLSIRVVGNEQHTITIDIPDATPGYVLQQRLMAATHDVPQSMLMVSKVGIRVTFDLAPDEKRPRTRKFELAWPNSCSLQNDNYGILIQRMLADHGIEPRRPSEDGINGSQGR